MADSSSSSSSAAAGGGGGVLEARCHKRAYRVLIAMCRHYPSFILEPDRLREVIDLLVNSILTCQVSARYLRLKCLASLMEGLHHRHRHQYPTAAAAAPKGDTRRKKNAATTTTTSRADDDQHLKALVPKIIGETLLCLKDSNAKTREAGYQLLLATANAGTLDDHHDGGGGGDKSDIFAVVLAALGSETTHMRSAAVMALSRLAFEYARDDPTVHGMLPSLLSTVLVLFQETSSREIIKSVVGFVRVAVAAMTSEQLEPILKPLMKGLFHCSKARDRFRAKIKIIVKKLVRVFGYDHLMPLVPMGDARLLTHMRKLSERTERRRVAASASLTGSSQPNHGGGGSSRNFEDMMDSDEDDSDGGRTLVTGLTTARTGKTTARGGGGGGSARSGNGSLAAASSRRTRGGAAVPAPRIRDATNGDVLDMLDPSMAKSVRFADRVGGGGGGDDDDDDDDGIDLGSDDDVGGDGGGAMEFDDLGRLIVRDDDDGDDKSGRTTKTDGDGGKKRKLSKFESAKMGNGGPEASVAKSKRKAKRGGNVRSLGAAYKSKKAGGDVKKRGQVYEPYAYVPLDGRDFTKKNRRNAVEKMATVVRSGGGGNNRNNNGRGGGGGGKKRKR